MRFHKRCIENYLFYDFRTIERRLAQMAAKGWRLEKIGRLGWHYRRAPAKKLTYAVEYLPQGSDFNAAMPASQAQFLEYCADAGWTLVATWAQMMVLVNEEPDPVPIETESQLQLNAIRRAMWKNFLPSTIVLLLLALLQLVLVVPKLFRNPIGIWSSTQLYMPAVWGVLGLLFAARLVDYFLWLRKAKRAAGAGEPLPGCAGRWLALLDYFALLFAVVMVFLMFWGLGGDKTQHFAVFALMIAALLLNYFLTDKLRDWMKSAGISAPVNRTVTIGFCAVFTIVALVGISFGAMRFLNAPEDGEQTHTMTLQNGQTWTVTLANDRLPLYLEDLTAVTGEAISCRAWIDHTPFLTNAEYSERVYDAPSGAPRDLSYTVLDVHADFLYDACLQQLLDDVNEDLVFDRRWEPIAPAAGMTQAYRVWYNEYDEFGHQFLFCWPGRIVTLEFYTGPTDAQITAAAQKLMP